ncbi:MAG: hypothetical protein IAG13_23525, partial [Deltaproteobacteria bacterium]|nr:hypothetical protein [Nannocystaceae bacterium]
MSRFPWSLALLLAPLPCLPACFAPDALNGDDDDGNDGQGDAETAEEDDSSASDDTGSSPSTTATTDAPGDESSAGEDDTDPSAADTGELPEGGHVAFVLEGELYVMAAQPEAQLRQLGPELDALAPGVDEDFIQLSSDGEWLLLSSERFDPQCAGYACLSVVPIDASVGEPVLRAGGEPIRMGSGNGAGITRGGDAIVFGAEGVNTRDLHYTHRDGDGWSDPVVLTANS